MFQLNLIPDGIQGLVKITIRLFENRNRFFAVRFNVAAKHA